jgi:hypothetical protein
MTTVPWLTPEVTTFRRGNVYDAGWASGQNCETTAGPGGWPDVDRQAEKHARGGHATATLAAPAQGDTTIAEGGEHDGQ